MAVVSLRQSVLLASVESMADIHEVFPSVRDLHGASRKPFRPTTVSPSRGAQRLIRQHRLQSLPSSKTHLKNVEVVLQKTQASLQISDLGAWRLGDA